VCVCVDSYGSASRSACLIICDRHTAVSLKSIDIGVSMTQQVLTVNSAYDRHHEQAIIIVIF